MNNSIVAETPRSGNPPDPPCPFQLLRQHAHRGFLIEVYAGEEAVSAVAWHPCTGREVLALEDCFAFAEEAVAYAAAEVDALIRGDAYRLQAEAGVMDPDGPQTRALWRRVAHSYGYALDGWPLEPLSAAKEAVGYVAGGELDALGDFLNTEPGRTLPRDFVQRTHFAAVRCAPGGPS